MIRNILKIALRNIIRNRVFSAINLLGLTLGTACCLYILLYIQDHRSYDKHHQGSENIYRVISDLRLGNDREVLHMSTCSPPIPPAIAEDFPEVAFATRACRPPGIEQFLIRSGEKVVYEEQGYYVDSTFFRVFDYHFVAGHPDHALHEPYSVVVSEQLANKLLGEEDALGQSIKIGDYGEEQDFKITGVFNSSLGNTHLLPEFFITMNSGSIGEYIRTNNSWAGNNFIYGYIRLNENADANRLEEKLPDFLIKHGENQLRDLGMNKVLHLQLVRDIHTSSGLSADIATNTNATFLRMLLLIAGFIQLVACINFMNLSTARSMHRAREVGVRKTVGAPRSTLIAQFIGESFLMVIIAVALSILLLQFTLPFINQLTNTVQSLHFDWSFGNISIALLLLLLTGLAAGSYPAFYLSSFKPIKVLKGASGPAGNKLEGRFRKSLVVSQFIIAIILVISAMVIHLQLKYMINKDLGFEKNQKVVFGFQLGTETTNPETFRNEIRKLPQVVNASAMSEVPGQPLVRDIPLYKRGESMLNAIDVRLAYVDEQFIKTLKIDLLSGRDFRLSDTASIDDRIRIILNETAARELDISLEDAPGTTFYSDFEDTHIEATVVGVMKDILYQNLTGEMGPFMVVAEPARNLRRLVVDVNTQDYPAFLQKTETVWNEVLPDLPFEYSFLDADMAKLYQTERTLSRIIGAFTIMAIFISCMGLFGLSAFAAEQRTKEVGIRKVLGASLSDLMFLLSGDFLKLILISLLIACPLGYFVMEKWLQEFAHRMEIHWWVFALSALIAISIAFITISFQSLKAAMSDPVESLRNE